MLHHPDNDLGSSHLVRDAARVLRAEGRAATCQASRRALAFYLWVHQPSFSSGVALAIHGSPYRRYPGKFAHSASSQFFSCSFGTGSTERRRLVHPSKWPSLQSCFHMSYNCRYNCCRSTIRLREAVGVRPSREACRMCCNKSIRYAIGCPLREEKLSAKCL